MSRTGLTREAGAEQEHGLAEFDPKLDSTRPLPRVYIRRVRVCGEETPLPWSGASTVALDLAPDRNQVEIEYAAADLRSASPLRFQYRLDGVDADWSAPSTRFHVNYASLPPGKRLVNVRAVGASGEIGSSAATVTVALAAPLWKRWWFVTSFALLATIIVVLVIQLPRAAPPGGRAIAYPHRHGFARRHRRQPDTDCTVEGSGQRDVSRNALGEIAQISRDLPREMSDIVWAVSPHHDRFDALAHRIRRFAEDALPDGQLAFDTAGLPGDLSLAIEYRRPLFLVFKEAVNNVARHSGATRMTVRLAVTDGVLRMAVEDNGVGFDPQEPAPARG